VRSEFPLSPLPEPLGGAVGHSLKHPSGLLEFAQRLERNARPIGGNNGGGDVNASDQLPTTFIDDLKCVDLGNLQTPASILLPSTAAINFRNAANLAADLSRNGITVSNAYSIKTNPDERLLRLALESGFFAEAISLLEVKKALQAGFHPGQITLNGPAKWWRRHELPEAHFYIIFCDSVEEVEQVGKQVKDGRVKTQFLGVRLRTPGITSRFGVPIDSPDAFGRLVRAVRSLPRDVQFGIHFHMASSNVGVREWWHLFESMLRWGGSIEALTGRLISLLDVGGGWFPEDISRDGAVRFRTALGRVPEFLSGVQQVITEPGKALAQPSMALAMQILEIRRSRGRPSEVVVDGSIAELPMHFFHPHRVLAREKGSWRVLGRGETMVLGRLCMEHDILAANVGLPESSREGDFLVFCDAGAYDRSMSYVFGCG
jgi:diaminopimelate decarboxylase